MQHMWPFTVTKFLSLNFAYLHCQITEAAPIPAAFPKHQVLNLGITGLGFASGAETILPKLSLNALNLVIAVAVVIMMMVVAQICYECTYAVNIYTGKLNTAQAFTSTVDVTFMLIIHYTKRVPIRTTILAVFALAFPK